MLLIDFEIFKQKYVDYCKTKSDNFCVLKLYSFLLKHEYVDSDFWSPSHGDGLGTIVNILEGFKELDWQDLIEDLPNWTDDQKDIFSEGLLTVDFCKKSFSLEDIKFIERRFELLPLIFKITTDSKGTLSENSIEFIKVYFDKVNPKNPAVINAIIEIKKRNDTQVWLDTATGEKVKNPNSALIESAYKKGMGY